MEGSRKSLIYIHIYILYITYGIFVCVCVCGVVSWVCVYIACAKPETSDLDVALSVQPAMMVTMLGGYGDGHCEHDRRR